MIYEKIVDTSLKPDLNNEQGLPYLQLVVDKYCQISVDLSLKKNKVTVVCKNCSGPVAALYESMMSAIKIY